MKTLSHKAYLFSFLVFTMTPMALIGGVNWFADSYFLFNAPRLPGYNFLKPNFHKSQRMAKSHIVARFQPAGIILGTSRAEVGLVTDHPFWQNESAYNLGLPGSTIYEALRYFQHSLATGRLKRVLLGIDYIMFNEDYLFHEGFEETRLLVNLYGKKTIGRLQDPISALFSFDALSDSLSTFKNQDLSRSPYVYHPDGRLEYTEYRLIEKGGHRKDFLSNEMDFITSHRSLGVRLKKDQRDLSQYFRMILELAHRHEIELTIFISPSHARQWEAVFASGSWNDWELWKKRMIELNEEVADSFNRPAFAFWDFSGFNRITQEKVPALGDVTSRMFYYWDSSHYTPQAGKLVLDRILIGKEDPTDDFGALINTTNLAAHLERIRFLRDLYQKKAAEDHLEIMNLVTSGKLPY